MAKTMPAASADRTSPFIALYRPINPSHRYHPSPQRRTSRSRFSPCKASPSPSSALLSILASIVASSPVVDGSPAPPPFLCPQLYQVDESPPQDIQRKSPSSSSSSSVHQHKARQPYEAAQHSASTIPYKFERGDDGVWRRVESYSLYGSTICSKNCREPTHSMGPAEDNVIDSTMVYPSNPVATTAGFDFLDSLPLGWNLPHKRSENHTTLILALSLVLAFFISFLIIGCLFWRKSLRRKHRESDVEMKTRRKRHSTVPITSTTSSFSNLETEVKAKKKIWARATARWKSNARYTARQRRGKRPAIARSQSYNSTTTFCPATTIQTTAEEASASSPRPVTSRQSSSLSLEDSSHSERNPQEQNQNQNDFVTDTNVPRSPPAYRQRALNVADESSTSVSQRNATNSTLISHNSPSLAVKSPFPSQDADGSLSVLHTAHLATDDKHLLARLTEYVEQPPAENCNTAQTSELVTVPEWEDERLEDFSPASDETPPITSDLPSSILPPPPAPSKGKMVESSFYGYRSSFEEFSDSIDPVLEPSAPPFDAPGGSLENDLLPSAPPLPEPEDHPEMFPTAPSCPISDVGKESVEDTDHHCGTTSAVNSPSEPTTPTLPSGPVHSVIRTSGGTLPDYQP